MRAQINMRSMPFAAMTSACLAGCAGSPTQNIFGSFFPSWMLCVFGGLIFAIVMHRAFAAAGIDKAIPAPFLVYLSLVVAFTFAAWLLWLG
ncbi:MAG TPA: YtcA family lipoprotein [Rudaea sp.]|nr:YtcA family lipoprotein [Rudaea sp.]